MMDLDSQISSASLRPRVLLVDDEPRILKSLQRLLRNEPYDIADTVSTREAIEAVRENLYAVVVSDQKMPAMEGTQLLEQIKQFSPDTLRIILTGYADIDAAMDAINRGEVYRFLTKPWVDNEVILTLRQAVAQFEVVRENRRLSELTDKQNEVLMLRVAEITEAQQAIIQARDREARIGFKIQKSLLFGPPTSGLRSVQVASCAIPSQGMDGDFYDFYEHSDTCLDVIIGDVMGKGIQAALLGAGIKGQCLRAVAGVLPGVERRMFDPAEIITLVRDQAAGQLAKLDSFATLCYARFDMLKERLDFVNCGHPRIIHLRHSTLTCELLEGDNMPLGFSECETITQSSTQFEESDVFLFCSDGLCEARNPEGEMLGVHRIVETVTQNPDLHPNEFIQVIRRVATGFTQLETFSDDLTCVVVRIGNPENMTPIMRDELTLAGDLVNIGQVRSFVRQFSRRLFDETPACKLEIATVEAYTNISRHALMAHGDRTVLMEVEIYSSRVVVRFSHGGLPYDGGTVQEPTWDGESEGGMGLYIVSACVDNIWYGQSPEGKQTVGLVKHLKGEVKNDCQN